MTRLEIQSTELSHDNVSIGGEINISAPINTTMDERKREL